MQKKACLYIRNHVILAILLLISLCSVAQESKVESKAYSRMLNTLLKHSVNEVSVTEAAQAKDVIFIDSREKQEYEVSHIQDAKWVGYDDFNMNRLKEVPKDRKIIVYCSVGARSENISLKLEEAGYKDVSNLYGGIFEWVNQGYPVYNTEGQTNKVHPYNMLWGVWLNKGEKSKEK